MFGPKTILPKQPPANDRKTAVLECDHFWPMPASCDAIFALELSVKLKTLQLHTFPVQSVLPSLTYFINVRSADAESQKAFPIPASFPLYISQALPAKIRKQKTSSGQG